MPNNTDPSNPDYWKQWLTDNGFALTPENIAEGQIKRYLFDSPQNSGSTPTTPTTQVAQNPTTNIFQNSGTQPGSYQNATSLLNPSGGNQSFVSATQSSQNTTTNPFFNSPAQGTQSALNMGVGAPSLWQQFLDQYGSFGFDSPSGGTGSYLNQTKKAY